ncbi:MULTISPECIES: VOC family protein [Chryseolinea]|jgi:catechol 2,3-dioxygenase-like lactoylglutathione lyase family enzyme|uniref:Catechol 2,3-dioxygenase n=2 Tax=Chryseolinea TaxID=1433993 RepID=A0A1M5K0I7_9BACT|nr:MULTISPECIES: VOC family protein [Chryseolinea]AYB33691.1 VOC family protein [Chryseolinea soli]SHG46284.1 Catechol 2,3-dioxygenase [Chryseolinea serpens]
MGYIISGIQQVGIGVQDADAAWAWYRKHFGMDVPVFKDSATASLMTRYTGDRAEDRYAILAMNMQGGGGFEIWQFTSRTPREPEVEHFLGDTGVFAVKLKTQDIATAYRTLKASGVHILNSVQQSPDGRMHFYVKDPFNNLFEITESKSWFKKAKAITGGVAGCVIGVTDIDKALKLYRDVLGYTEVLYDGQKKFEDFEGVPGGENEFRRVILRSNKNRMGAFCRLLGETELELVEVKNRAPQKIFHDRYWGDLGYIHICFDINGMEQLADRCQQANFSFTVDSRDSFDMGKAAGHFSYCEDPDGTLIEFVETHKIPIVEKIGWYLNIRHRDPGKPLPDWMLGMLALNRVKD